MKRILVIAMIAMVGLFGVANATNNDPVKPRVVKAFEKTFPNASYAKWKQLPEYGMYTVNFGYNNQSMLAYVDEEGVILATVRLVSKENLPFIVNDRVSRKYEGWTILRIEELTTDSETSYLFLLEKNQTRMSVRTFSNGITTELKREKIREVASMIK